MGKKILDDSEVRIGINDHNSVVPPNLELERKKEEARKRKEELIEQMGIYIPKITTLSGEEKLITNLNLEEQEVEIIRCTKSPIYFICTYLTIFDQTQGEGGQIVPFELFPFQKELIETYKEERFVVANKYRQAGVSTCTSAYIAWYMGFNKNRNVAIVADKLETAMSEMMKDVVDFLESCPTWLTPRPTIKDTQKHKIYDNGNELRAFASNSLRGFTPTLLFWDETAWAEKGEKFWTAAKPTLQTGGRAIFVSTPNGLEPVFYKTFTGAKNKKNDNNFFAFELWWYNDPRYTRNKEGKFDLEWIKNKGKEHEIRLKDEHWSHEKRAQLVEDGWEASSSWFEFQVKDYNGDMKKLAQELLCVFGDSIITVRNKLSGLIEKINVDMFYKKLEEENNRNKKQTSTINKCINFLQCN